MSDAASFDYRELDELIHSRQRLGILTILVAADEVDFSYLREKLDLTDGNLGTHLRKLEEAKYVAVRKKFVERRPRTTYRLTARGRAAFEAYIARLESFLKDVQRGGGATG